MRLSAGMRPSCCGWRNWPICNSAIHTNAIEEFYSKVKRGIIGSYHKVGHKYLPLYVNELEFRYNNRENNVIFDAAIRAR